MVIMLKLASTTKQHYVIKDEVDNIISSHWSYSGNNNDNADNNKNNNNQKYLLVTLWSESLGSEEDEDGGVWSPATDEAEEL